MRASRVQSSLAIARHRRTAIAPALFLFAEYRPEVVSSRLSFAMGVFHHIPPGDRIRPAIKCCR